MWGIEEGEEGRIFGVFFMVERGGGVCHGEVLS